jgi:hypothetical protein
MPQALAAMSIKMTMPRILSRFGYRRVLISNTVILGLTSSASTIASTMQQMSISFGVAMASLATAFFSPTAFGPARRRWSTASIWRSWSWAG